MAETKSLLFRKKIEEIIYDLNVKTNADNVYMTEAETTLTQFFLNYPTATEMQIAIDDAIDRLIDGAPEALDTLREVAEWVAEHETLYDALVDALSNKVDKIEGKGLSSNDFTDELLEKLISLYNYDDTELRNKITNHVSDFILHITSTERTNWNDANTKKHEHSNKTVLDSITSALIPAWNSAVTHISDAVKHVTATERTNWNGYAADISNHDSRISVLEDKPDIEVINNLTTSAPGQGALDAYQGKILNDDLSTFKTATGVSIAAAQQLAQTANTAAGTAQSTANTANTTANTAQASVKTANDNIATLQTKLNDLTDTVSNIPTIDLTDIEDAITAIQEKSIIQGTTIGIIQEDIAKLYGMVNAIDLDELSQMKTQIQEIIDLLGGYDFSDVVSDIGELQTTLNSHTSNSVIHITSTERTNWNDANTKKHEHSNKNILDGITSALITAWNSAVTHISDAIRHITAEERTSWNAKAPISHASTATTYGISTSANYGHAMASSTTPLVAGTATIGIDNGKFAREGHVHPAQTTISGNAGTSTTAINLSGGTVNGTTGTFTDTLSIAGISSFYSDIKRIGNGDKSIIFTDTSGTVLGQLRNNSLGATILSSINSTIYIRPINTTSSTAQATLSTTGVFTATTFSGALSGNATTATTWATIRTLSWTGDATGSMFVNGSADVSAALTLAPSGATAGSYGPVTDITLGFGDTIIVPYITVDSKGRITAVIARNMVLPAEPTTITGNSGTTTKLATARLINGISFDGTSDVQQSVITILIPSNTEVDTQASSKMPLSNYTAIGTKFTANTIMKAINFSDLSYIEISGSFEQRINSYDMEPATLEIQFKTGTTVIDSIQFTTPFSLTPYLVSVSGITSLEVHLTAGKIYADEINRNSYLTIKQIK